MKGAGSGDDRQGDCLRQSCDPYVGSCYLLCDGANADHCVRVCVCFGVVSFSEQSIIDAGSAFDLSGQTCPQCELTAGN